MADLKTVISPRELSDDLRGSGIGLAEWGRHTRPEMLAAYRKYHEKLIERGTRALAFTDDELVVYLERGWTRGLEVTE